MHWLVQMFKAAKKFNKPLLEGQPTLYGFSKQITGKHPTTFTSTRTTARLLCRNSVMFRNAKFDCVILKIYAVCITAMFQRHPVDKPLHVMTTLYTFDTVTIYKKL